MKTRAFKLSWFSLIGLMILSVYLVAFHYKPVSSWEIFLAVLYIGLLFTPLYGMLKHHSMTFFLSANMALIYFSHGVIEAYANDAIAIYAWIEIVLSCMLFIYAIKRSKELKKEKD